MGINIKSVSQNILRECRKPLCSRELGISILSAKIAPTKKHGKYINKGPNPKLKYFLETYRPKPNKETAKIKCPLKFIFCQITV
jgi:hypothetical protein